MRSPYSLAANLIVSLLVHKTKNKQVRERMQTSMFQTEIALAIMNSGSQMQIMIDDQLKAHPDTGYTDNAIAMVTDLVNQDNRYLGTRVDSYV